MEYVSELAHLNRNNVPIAQKVYTYRHYRYRTALVEKTT